MSSADDESQEWHELDQASTRKSIRDIIRHYMPDDASQKMPALQQLLTIVQEEIAEGLATHVTLILGHRDAESRQGARKIVAQLDRELTSLRLAVEDPGTGKLAQLSVARQPPQHDHESWIQLVALDDPDRPLTRLTYPVPRLKLVPEPTRDRSAGRGRP